MFFLKKKKKLASFLEKEKACLDLQKFAMDMTLKQFLKQCERGDWILWLFSQTNQNDEESIILASAHCVNTVRHILEDQRSIEALDVAIRFGNGLASKNELISVISKASDAKEDAYFPDNKASTYYATAAVYYCVSGDAAKASYYASDSYGCVNKAELYKAENQRLSADICRKYLPLKIWDQSKI